MNGTMFGKDVEKMLTFSEAFEIIRNDDNAAIYREGWNGVKAGKTMMIKTQLPDDHSANTAPYAYIFVVSPDLPKGYKRLPWLVSQEDLYATDWMKVE